MEVANVASLRLIVGEQSQARDGELAALLESCGGDVNAAANSFFDGHSRSSDARPVAAPARVAEQRAASGGRAPSGEQQQERLGSSSWVVCASGACEAPRSSHETWHSSPTPGSVAGSISKRRQRRAVDRTQLRTCSPEGASTVAPGAPGASAATAAARANSAGTVGGRRWLPRAGLQSTEQVRRYRQPASRGHFRRTRSQVTGRGTSAARGHVSAAQPRLVSRRSRQLHALDSSGCATARWCKQRQHVGSGRGSDARARRESSQRLRVCGDAPVAARSRKQRCSRHRRWSQRQRRRRRRRKRHDARRRRAPPKGRRRHRCSRRPRRRAPPTARRRRHRCIPPRPHLCCRSAARGRRCSAAGLALTMRATLSHAVP